MSFNGGIMPVLVNGKNFVYFQNPNSTTRATGFRAQLGEMAGGIIADQASKAAAKGAAKQEFTRQAKSGADLGTAVESSAAAADNAYQSTNDSVSSASDLRGTKPEYVIRNAKTGVQVVVSERESPTETR